MTDRNPMNELPAETRARLRRNACLQWVPPMLATLTEERFSRHGWIFETKFDGERCLALRCGSELQLWSRNHKQLNDRYPELVAAFQNQKEERFAVDGEIVALEGDVSSFSKLQ